MRLRMRRTDVAAPRGAVRQVGFLPWYGPDGFVAKVEAEEDSSAYIMGTFAEALWGRSFGVFFALVVVVTIYGSVLSMLTGMMYARANAAPSFARCMSVLRPQGAPS